jgi:hypothetical protein
MERHLSEHVLPLVSGSVIHIELHHQVVLGLLGLPSTDNAGIIALCVQMWQ